MNNNPVFFLAHIRKTKQPQKQALEDSCWVRSKCDDLKIAQLVGEVLQFKCLHQIFAITVLRRKRGRTISSFWSCLNYKTILPVTSKGLWLPERSLGLHCHHRCCHNCKLMLSSLNSVMLHLHGRRPGVFVVPSCV